MCDCQECFQCRREKYISTLTVEKTLPGTVPQVIIQNLTIGDSCSVISPDKNTPYKFGYFLHGRSGQGKSHEAAALMLHCIISDYKNQTRNRLYSWVNVPDLLFRIRSTYQGKDENMESEKSIVDYYSSVDWLCLDDLGVEKVSDWALQTLYLIINKRYENMKTTVVTSNLSPEELIERFGDDRLPSRIMAMCKPIAVSGNDRRIK